MNEETVREWARMLTIRLPEDRVETVTAQLEGQIAEHGGLSPEELEGIEPAIVLEPEWAE